MDPHTSFFIGIFDNINHISRNHNNIPLDWLLYAIENLVSTITLLLTPFTNINKLWINYYIHVLIKHSKISHYAQTTTKSLARSMIGKPAPASNAEMVYCFSNELCFEKVKSQISSRRVVCTLLQILWSLGK
jgi:hypothetical protein